MRVCVHTHVRVCVCLSLSLRGYKILQYCMYILYVYIIYTQVLGLMVEKERQAFAELIYMYT